MNVKITSGSHVPSSGNMATSRFFLSEKLEFEREISSFSSENFMKSQIYDSKNVYFSITRGKTRIGFGKSMWETKKFHTFSISIELSFRLDETLTRL